ncbi:MAG: hypothetical protein KO206_00210, partial [Methanomicrobiaceae archaeon]|nr:hypothetical protein [Methanomicrobiaceae archaeon]
MTSPSNDSIRRDISWTATLLIGLLTSVLLMGIICPVSAGNVSTDSNIWLEAEFADQILPIQTARDSPAYESADIWTLRGTAGSLNALPATGNAGFTAAVPETGMHLPGSREHAPGKLFLTIDCGYAPVGMGGGAVVPAPNPGEPDLVVTEISWLPEGPEAGDEIAMQATIMNQGTGLTPDSVVHGVLFTTDSAGMSQGVWSDNHTAPIAPGESVTVTANGGSQGSTWTAVEGTHTITARVDDQNRIAESDEDNNLLTGAMTVETSAPIDPASGADANPTGN